MSLSNSGFYTYAYAVLAFAPLLAAPILYRIHLHREATKTERNDGVEAAFAPADPPAPSLLLRRFSLPERTYLLRYKSGLFAAFGLLIWIFLFSMSSGLLPSAIAKTGFAGSVQQNIWYSYIDKLTLNSSLIFTILPMIAGGIAVAEIGVIASARFPRSRPISRRLLFWGRVLPALAAMLTAIVLAAVLSLLLLRVSYGPVYGHLHAAASTLSHSVTASGDDDDLTQLLQTSLPRLILSGLTTAMLGFSIVVAVMMLPFQAQRHPILTVLIYLGAAGYQMYFVFIAFEAPAFARFLFVYMEMGAPPPYAYALGPILLSIALLLIASKLSDRLQT